MSDKDTSDLKSLLMGGIIVGLLVVPLVSTPLYHILNVCLWKLNTTDNRHLSKSPTKEKCTSVYVIWIFAEISFIITGILAIIAIIKNQPKLRKLAVTMFCSIPVFTAAAGIYEWARFRDGSAVVYCFWFLGIWGYSYLHTRVLYDIHSEITKKDSSDSEFTLNVISGTSKPQELSLRRRRRKQISRN